MGRPLGFMLLIALIATACGGSSGYSAAAETEFVAGCSKATTTSLATQLGTSERTAAETAAIQTYCHATLTCLEQAVSPGTFAQASKDLHDRKTLAPAVANAMGVCQRTAGASTNLTAAFEHDYPASARTQFLASCRKTAMASVAKLRRGHRLTKTQKAAVAANCGANLSCVAKVVTIDQFAALDRALRTGKQGDRTVRTAIDHCAATNMPALRAAFRS
jgi:hypothetical protein